VPLAAADETRGYQPIEGEGGGLTDALQMIRPRRALPAVGLWRPGSGVDRPEGVGAALNEPNGLAGVNEPENVARMGPL
jgi:hypothetical protein